MWESDSFGTKVGLHEGSALSPFLFALGADPISIGVHAGLLQQLLYPDDLANTCTTKASKALESELHG